MTSQRDFLERLARLLEANGIAFMVVGSVASSFHGEPRATRDIDIVIEGSPDQLAAFVEAALGLDWYVDPDAATTALADHGMFNVIDPTSGWKADLIVRKRRAFSAAEFERRFAVRIFDTDSMPLMISTPEDTILSKLEWSRDAHTEQQYRDALAVAALDTDRLDLNYLRRWADELGLTEVLERLLAEAARAG